MRFSPEDTVFVTGGGSGIGMGLASAIHARGARVIIAGRDVARLEAVASRHPGMEAEAIDVCDFASIDSCLARVAGRHPALNVLINNAGIQNLLDFRDPEAIDPEAIRREIATNLTGMIEVTSRFLPLLRERPRARLVHVGSGLAYVPLVAAPVYSATKAGVHAFTVALRRQLRGVPPKIIELIPPAVETGLHAGQDRRPPGAMPLDAFVRSAMLGLEAGREEVAVGLAKILRIGSRISPGFFLSVVNKRRSSAER